MRGSRGIGSVQKSRVLKSFHVGFEIVEWYGEKDRLRTRWVRSLDKTTFCSLELLGGLDPPPNKSPQVLGGLDPSPRMWRVTKRQGPLTSELSLLQV